MFETTICIYVALERLFKKTNTCNNTENSSTAKVNKHILSGYSLFTHCSLDATKIALIFTEIKTA